MTILVEDADFNEETGFCDHYDVYCSEQSEWDDIKIIVNYALETWDKTSLAYEISKDTQKGLDQLDMMKRVCALINGMDKAPDKIYRSDFVNLMSAVTHLYEVGRYPSGISHERHKYLVKELHKPTETELRVKARLKERENTPE